MAGRKTTRQHGVQRFNQLMTGRQPSRFFKRGVAAFITAIVTALLAVTAGPGNVTTAHAWTDGNRYWLGYQFNHNTVTYFIDPTTVPSWDNGNIHSSANAWTYSNSYNNEQSNLYYIPGGTSTSTADVAVTGYKNYDQWSGHGGCRYTWSNAPTVCPSRSGVGYVELYFDPNHTSAVSGDPASFTDTPTLDQAHAGHEQGHSFGLDHSCVNGSLMAGPNTTFNCGGYNPPCAEPNCIDTPQPDDMDGAIQLYGAFTPPSPPPVCRGILCTIHQSGTTKPQIVQWLESFPPDQIPLSA